MTAPMTSRIVRIRFFFDIVINIYTPQIYAIRFDSMRCDAIFYAFLTIHAISWVRGRKLGAARVSESAGDRGIGVFRDWAGGYRVARLLCASGSGVTSAAAGVLSARARHRPPADSTYPECRQHAS